VIKTSDLIDVLAAELRPVRRLRPPVVRAVLWLAMAALVFGALAGGLGVRPDLAQQLLRASFVTGIAGSLLTSVLAAVAAFMIDLPDRSRRWAWLPVPALVVWLTSIGYGCLTDWVGIGPDGLQFGETARCFSTVLLASLPLALAMFLMLRRGAVLRPASVAITGSLAVAALCASAMSLVHSLDATVLVLVWNFGSAALIVLVGGVFGRSAIATRDLGAHSAA
jgi:hypothetical protein